MLHTALTVLLSMPHVVGVPARVRPDDAVLGTNIVNGSLRLVRDQAIIPTPWSAPVARWVEFDNSGALGHNPDGNLLAVKQFDDVLGSGIIHNVATNGTADFQVIGDTAGTGAPAGTLQKDWLNGLSANQSNTRIALTGGDFGRVIVFDYDAGPTPGTGAGATLSRGRQSAAFLPTFLQGNRAKIQGTCWLDSDTIAVLAATGDVYLLDSETMQHSLAAHVDVAPATNIDNYTIVVDIEYNRAISPYLYALYSDFNNATAAKRTRLAVLDPRFGMAPALQGIWDFGTAIDSPREIAFNSAGDLLTYTFGTAANRGKLMKIPGAASPANIADNSAALEFQSTFAEPFPGLDIACATPIPAECRGDINFDGRTDTADLVQLLLRFGRAVPIGQNGDLDRSGFVNTTDLTLLLVGFGCSGQ